MAVRRFYRATKQAEARRADFLSRMAQGRATATSDAEVRRLEDGVSVYDDLEHLRGKARAIRGLGRWIATLDIPDDAGIPIEKTLDDPHHFTLWGEPDELLRFVVLVQRV